MELKERLVPRLQQAALEGDPMALKALELVQRAIAGVPEALPPAPPADLLEQRMRTQRSHSARGPGEASAAGLLTGGKGSPSRRRAELFREDLGGAPLHDPNAKATAFWLDGSLDGARAKEHNASQAAKREADKRRAQTRSTRHALAVRLPVGPTCRAYLLPTLSRHCRKRMPRPPRPP